MAFPSGGAAAAQRLSPKVRSRLTRTQIVVPVAGSLPEEVLDWIAELERHCAPEPLQVWVADIGGGLSVPQGTAPSGIAPRRKLHLQVLTAAAGRGFGPACAQGMLASLVCLADFVLVLTGPDPPPPAVVWEMLEAMEEADVVLARPEPRGSGGRFEHWTRWAIARLAAPGLPLPGASLTCWRAAHLRRTPYPLCGPGRYRFEMEMLVYAARLGGKIREASAWSAERAGLPDRTPSWRDWWEAGVTALRLWLAPWRGPGAALP